MQQEECSVQVDPSDILKKMGKVTVGLISLFRGCGRGSHTAKIAQNFRYGLDEKQTVKI
jgi:hypothetical protein